MAESPSPYVANGLRQYVYFVAKAQAELGLEVSVFWLSGESNGAIPGVFARGFSPPLLPFCVPRALLETLEDRRPELLHLHSTYFPPHFTLARWARRFGIPYVVAPHGALFPGEIRQRWFLKLPYKYVFERRTLNGAVFVQTLNAAEDLRGYGVAAPIERVPSGIDPSLQKLELKRRFFDARQPMLQGRRIFLYLGRLEPVQKGLDLLLRAFAGAGLDRAALVLVGPDYRGGRRRLERLRAQLRPRQPILLLGPVYGKERFEIVASADVFVSTSRWEGMPLAVLEAAALGVPCLLTVPADPFGLLARGAGGIAVEPEVDSIAEGMQKMHRASDSELREMGERARSIVSMEFPWKKVAQDLAAVYAKYVAPPGTRSRE